MITIHIVDDSLIHSEREPLGELTVVSENHLMNTPEVCQGVNIRIKGIEEIGSETGRLRFIESISLLNVHFGCAEDFYPHETFFLILF